MKNIEELTKDLLTTNKTLKQIAKEQNVYIRTLSTKIKKHLNITTIQDVIALYDQYNINDIRKIFSPRDKKIKNILNDINKQTNFLPKSAGLRERLFYIKTNTQIPPRCLCGNFLSWNTTTQKEFNKFCSPHCKFAIEHANAKRIKTNISKRNVAFPYLDPSVRQKRDKTMIYKYGDTSFQRSKIKKQTLNLLKNKELFQSLYQQHATTLSVAKHLGVSQSYISSHMQKYNIIANNISAIENKIKTYINDLGVKCIKTRKIIPPHEIDIFIPSKNIGIEINGNFWHSEKFKTSSYHKEKLETARKKGIQLIQIFEHEITNRFEIVKSRIASLLNKNHKIHARDCSIKIIGFDQANDFFEQTHLQGGCNALFYNIGLFYNNELVACMGFSKSRFNKNVDFELVRYSSKLYTTVVGGASKIFKYFITNYPNKTIICYCDKRWNVGNLYKQLNFKFIRTTAPNYFYFKNNDTTKIFSRIKFQKHKLKNILEKYDPNLSEWENMQNNGYNRIWDCGNDVWIFNIHKK